MGCSTCGGKSTTIKTNIVKTQGVKTYSLSDLKKIKVGR